MAVNIKTLVDLFVTQVNDQDYNIAEDINALQEALDALAYANIGQAGFANTQTLSGTLTLTDDSAVLQFLNPNASDQIVTLPAVAVTNHPFVVMNTNGSNYVLTVKNSGGTVIRIIPAGKTFLLVSNGSQWVVSGFDLYKTISPTQITASQNNYNPSGAYEADIMRIDGDAAWNITGLAGGSAGRIKIIRNVGAFTFTFKNEDASSTAANRFDFGADFSLESKKTMMLIYDGTSSRWGMIGGGGASTDGWVSSSATWSYSSADSPTFVISINADVTATIGVGMRIKLTQTTEKYFIVTAVGSYSGSATLVTVYGGTDYTLANSAISSPYYSQAKTPFGFPMSPDKWTTTTTDSTDRTQSSPVQNTVYNLGSISAAIPIGVWHLTFGVLAWANSNAAQTNVGLHAGLSTSNSSFSDTDLKGLAAQAGASGTLACGGYIEINRTLTLTSKTTYYAVAMTGYTGQASIIFYNSSIRPLKIILRCAYL